MLDNKPYLLRAMLDWIEDSDCTPYLYIDTSDLSKISAPAHLLESNPLVFNIASQSCNQLLIDNESVRFEARFSGEVHNVYVDMDSVIAIIARENGQGMQFEPAKAKTQSEQTTQNQSSKKSLSQIQKQTQGESNIKKSKLKIID